MLNKNVLLGALSILILIAYTAMAEVIVTGKALRSSTVSPLTVVDSEELELRGTTNISELLSQLPPINTGRTATGGTANVDLRGLGSDASLILIDGVRSTAQVNINTIPTSLIDRVEILSGPQGTLYGGNATSGAINIVTRPEFQPVNPGGSFTLDGIKNLLNPYAVAIESNEECDATHGSPMPWWTGTPGIDNVRPNISEDGEIFSWGNLDGGYTPPSTFLPGLYDMKYGENWFRDDTPKVDLGSFLFDFEHTYNALDALRDRIRSTPGMNEQDKRDFAMGLMFGYGFFGMGGLSDDAVLTGTFDPEALYQEFLEFSRTRTDEERAQTNEVLESWKLDPFADFTGPQTTTTQVDSTAPTGPPPPAETPAPPATTAIAPANSKYFYDARFDLEQCDNEVKDDNGETQRARLARYLAERWQARADWGARADYLLSDWERELNESKGETAAEARGRFVDLNTRINAEWWYCQNGIATPPDLVATSSQQPAPAETANVSDASANLGMSLGYSLTDKLDLRLHIEYVDRGDGAPSGPAAGLVGDVSRMDYHNRFPLAFGTDVEKNPDLFASRGTGKAFSDVTGTMTFDGAIGGSQDTAEEDTDFSSVLGASYNFDSIKARLGTDWSMYYDRDTENKRGGPSIGLRYQYEPVDSVYVATVPGFSIPRGLYGDAGSGGGINLTDSASDYLSFGKQNYLSFDYNQFQPVNPGMFDGIDGMTYWQNNECGDSALPPEGSGYLTADESRVKSVSDQWAFRHVGLSGDEPSLDEFADDVIVAVIDTGLDWHHLDFGWDNLWRNEDEIPDNGIDDDNNGYVDDLIGWSFVDNTNWPWDADGHGTFVAGVVAGTQGNDAGIDGINGHAKIMVLKALNNFGRTRATLVAKAIVYAADNGAQLINLSVTGPGFPRIVQDAVDYATEKGALVINAAGNKAEDIDVAHPDALHGVLTVAATGPDDERAVFSNVGTGVSVAAPGIDVVSLRARGTDFMYNSADTSYVKGDAFLGEDRRYYRGTGTSFATPIVTGVASLLLSRNPGLKPADVIRVIEQSARDVGVPGRDRFTGYGVVDAKAALAADPNFFINAEIAGAQPVEIAGQPFMDVFGIAEADQFSLARIEIGQGESPDSWQGVGGVLAKGVQEGSLAQIPIASLAGTETWTLRLTVEHASGKKREARLIISL